MPNWPNWPTDQCLLCSIGLKLITISIHRTAGHSGTEADWRAETGWLAGSQLRTDLLLLLLLQLLDWPKRTRLTCVSTPVEQQIS